MANLALEAVGFELKRLRDAAEQRPLDIDEARKLVLYLRVQDPMSEADANANPFQGLPDDLLTEVLKHARQDKEA